MPISKKNEFHWAEFSIFLFLETRATTVYEAFTANVSSALIWMSSLLFHILTISCNSHNPTMSAHILLKLTHIIHFVNVLICIWMWNPICSHRVLQVHSQTSHCHTAAPVTQDYTEWGSRQWKHIRAGNDSDIWLTKLYIHQVNWRMESNSSTSGETKQQKEKHCCLIRMRHESCGLQLQLWAKYKDALTYMIYMTYMIYISMSLPHLSYFYCYAAPKWQKQKSNQIHIRSDWVAALVLSSHWDLDLVLLLDAYWR